MIYHHIALNVPISDGIFTYHHPQALPLGARVVVLFRGKPLTGIVWAVDITPTIALEKILPIVQVWQDEPPLPADWRQLLEFTARYYHYPLGQTVATALPQGLKENKAITLPMPSELFSLNDLGRAQNAPSARFHKQLALWQALLSDGISLADLKNIHNNAPKLLAKWREMGWLNVFIQQTFSDMPSENILNTQQQHASTQIAQNFNQFKTFLLYGVTGSGKTEVYFDAMAKVLAQGKQVLFLLPEINLTPQLLKRVKQRFTDVPTALLHSQTASGKRTQDYLRAMLGQAKLIIGTRLAVFTPLNNVGLIVVDEEHDSSFKQDNELRYHARDLAIWRAKQANCPIVLGSATPSLESWHKAQTDAYQLLELSQRAHQGAQMPNVDILDIRQIKLDNGFSPPALQLLQQNFAAGGMSLVYLNRRGFAPALFCGDCGHTFGCPNCSAKRVLHQRAHQLRCHHCDYRRPVPRHCPDCGNQDLTAIGHGTQRIEETLRQFLPRAKVARVDRDSTSHQNDWVKLYENITQNQIDILVGTQMLAKGHDFARLNLVVILNADGSLYSADFRAPERLFAELMQVSGRAGRANNAGKVLIQTQLPDHAVFHAVKAQDYRFFAENELSERKMFDMPPFGFQTAIRADAPNVEMACAFLNQIKDQLSPQMPADVAIFGAVPLTMMRLAERERAQVFLESTSRKHLHHAVSLWQQALQRNREHNIRWSIDIDPQEM